MLSGQLPDLEQGLSCPSTSKSGAFSRGKRELAMQREYQIITFDCYGTLIDWETGIRATFKQALKDLELSHSEEAGVFDLYEEEEKRIEALSPHRSYREVLSEAASAAARRFGKNIPKELSALLAEQLPGWNPFPDTNPALERLASRGSEPIPRHRTCVKARNQKCVGQ